MFAIWMLSDMVVHVQRRSGVYVMLCGTEELSLTIKVTVTVKVLFFLCMGLDVYHLFLKNILIMHFSLN